MSRCSFEWGRAIEGGVISSIAYHYHTHPFTVCSFHITCRMAVSDTDMGKQRHAAGVLTGRDEGICMPRCSFEWGKGN